MQLSDRQAFDAKRKRPSISDVLRRDIDDFAIELRRSNRLLRYANKGELSPSVFGHYLRSIHFLLRHTPIHLSMAEEHARRSGHPDLAAFFAHKRAEEEGHDRWAEADIAGLARKFGVTVPDEPTPEMRAIVDANAATIRENPFFYLAYVLFAEYSIIVIGPEWIRALVENCRIPASLITAVGNHVELDKDHVAEGCAEIDAFLKDRDSAAMRGALESMMQRFSAFCDGLCDIPH